MINTTTTALLATLLIPCFSVHAGVKSEPIDYQDGDTLLQGRIFYDPEIENKRLGVLVVHEWWGLNEHAVGRAEELAKLGYVAFAVDMYGSGRRTDHPEQAKQWMSEITSNIDAWQRRARSALQTLRSHPAVAAEHIAAIGYCFGGATVMQMAYAGEDLAGVASFHGSLPPATPEQANRVRSAVYVAHGADDAFVPADRVTAFKAALAAAGVDLKFTTFPGVKHSFTNPDASRYGMENLAYDADADAVAWQEVQEFLKKVFGR